MPWPRAYLGIAACAIAATGCNQVFGLDDHAVEPPLPDGPPPVPVCLEESFATLDTAIWTQIDPAGLTVAVDGELGVHVQGQMGAFNGLTTVGLYDFTDGELTVDLADPSISGSEAYMEIFADENNLFRIAHFNALLVFEFTQNGIGMLGIIQGGDADTVWRFRHDRTALIWETGTDRTQLTPRHTEPVSSSLTSVAVTLAGKVQVTDTDDRIAFDNLVLAGEGCR